MRKIRLILAVIFLAASVPAVFADSVYTGYLSGDSGDTNADGLLDGTGFWINEPDDPIGEYTPTEFEWTVTENPGGSWNYSYALRVYRAEASHWILETSDAFELDDMINPSGSYADESSFVLDTHTGTGTPVQPNPYMPDDVYGVKIEDTSGNGTSYADISYEYKVEFDSWRRPVWADSYAKCGNVGGTQNTAYNVGFTSPDTDPDYSVSASDGSYNNHVLAPDTEVPEPTTVVLLGCGLAGLEICRRRKSGE